MFSKKFRFITAIVLVISLISLAGCGKSGSTSTPSTSTNEKVTITFVNWVASEEGTRDQVKDVIAQFEKDNPNIKVDIKPVPVSDIGKQLSIMVAGNNPPDLAQVHPDDVVSLAAMNALEPTDGILSKEFLADVQQSEYDLTVYQGKHFGIPWAPAGPGFLYNKKLMQQAGLDPNKPPQTIDEMMEMIKIAKDKLPKDVVSLQLDTTIRTIGLLHEWPFMRAFGAMPVDGDKAKLNTPEMQAYTEWLRSMVKNGYTLPGKKYGEFRTLAAQDRLLFAVDGSYLKGIVKSLNKQMTDEEFYKTWGVAAIPGGKDGKHYAAPDDHFMVVFKNSKNKAAAAKLAEYLANSEYSLKKYIDPVGFVPATKSAVQRVPSIGNDPIRKGYIEKIVPTVVPLPYGPNYSKTAETIMAAMQEAITTDKPIKDILANAQTKLEGVLSGK